MEKSTKEIVERARKALDCLQAPLIFRDLNGRRSALQDVEDEKHRDPVRAALDRLEEVEARMREPDGFITVEYDRPHYRPTRAYPSCRPFIYIDGGFHD